jgi:hypothetical protein
MKEVPLTKGQVMFVDDADYALATTRRWCAVWDEHSQSYRAKGNIKTSGGYKQVTFHRWLLNAPPESQVDHRDGNPLNNQRENLRLATHGQNQQNKKRQRNNLSGFKGVCYVTAKRKYKAYISKDGKRYNLGYFGTAQEAADAYAEMAKELHQEFACLDR